MIDCPAEGVDFYGAGAVRFDTKVEGGPLGEGGERYYNHVLLVRGGGVTATPDGDSNANDTAPELEFAGSNGPGGQGGEGRPPASGQPGGAPDFAAAAETLGVSEDDLRSALGGPPPDFEAAAAALGVTVEALQDALGALPQE